jgi:hypothetical protein
MAEERPELPHGGDKVPDEAHKKWFWVVCGKTGNCNLDEDSETIWYRGGCEEDEDCECIPIRQLKQPLPGSPEPRWRRFQQTKKGNYHPETYWYACICVRKKHEEEQRP